MRTIFTVGKIDGEEGFEVTIPAGTEGEDVIGGIAHLLAGIYQREHGKDAEFTMDPFINYIKEYAKCVIRGL